MAKNEKDLHRCKSLFSLVGRAGIEPATNGLRALDGSAIKRIFRGL
jgi:hypothetical protein